MRTKKSLGQNFLTDRSILESMIKAAEINKDDFVIEIGPGHGELTQFILKKSPKKIIAIEKDNALAENLRGILGNPKNLEVINGDILKILPGIISNYSLQTTHYKLIGNIPYYITGQLLRIVSELHKKPSLIVLTLQKEVAERICAFTPRMNLLSASVQFWAEPKIVGIINKKSFKPVPNVDGAIIKLVPKPVTTNDQLPINYYKLIKILFKQPRKTILNNLISGFEELYATDIIEKLKESKISANLRPQDLSISQIMNLNSVIWQ